MWEQDLLNDWSDEFGINGMTFIGYDDLGEYAGMSYGTGYGTPRIRVDVKVDRHYSTHGLICRGILWHEFIHAFDYWNSGEMTHTGMWRRMYLKRFHLVFLGLLAPLVRW